jgi:hypothetical protein
MYNQHSLENRCYFENSDDIMTRQQAGWPRTYGSIPGRVRDFCLRRSVNNGPGAHPATYTIGARPGASSLGVKRPGQEADRTSPSSSKEWVELYLHSSI